MNKKSKKNYQQGDAFAERVTGIEPALSAWESVPSRAAVRPDLGDGASASDRERPPLTGVNGPLMARRPGTSFGWERPLGHLKDERLRWLPDVSVLK